MPRIAWNKGIRTTSKILPCPVCAKDFVSYLLTKSRKEKKTCSNECANLLKKRNCSIYLNCNTCHEEFRVTRAIVDLGRKYCSRICFRSNPDYLEVCRKRVLGENSPTWRGGITVIYRGIRRSPEYVRARKLALKRDNYTCTICGATEQLHVDHIKPFSLFPELAFDIKNMRVLCFPCHKKTPTYGINVRRNGRTATLRYGVPIES